jgi:hypothetical protein
MLTLLNNGGVMSRKNQDFIVVVAVLLSLFTLFKINGVENLLEGKIQQQESAIKDLEREINSIYSNVDQKLKEQASILNDYKISFDENYNPDSYTVSANISLTPKEFTESLTASIQLNDDIYLMQKNGTSFDAAVEVSIFDEFLPKVVLDKDGVQKIETIEDYEHYDIKSNYILDLFCHFSHSTSYRSGKLKYNGDIIVEYKELKNNGIEKISVMRELNGETIDEKEVEMNEHRLIALDESIELDPNDKFSIYVNVTDKYGLKYKCIVLYYEIDSEGKAIRLTPEWTNGSLLEIKDKGGKVLYELEINQ